MPQFLLSIYADETRYANMTPEEFGRLIAEHTAFSQAAEAAGVLRGGEALEPTDTATTVRVRDGERLLTDGPFAETREQLGGYYVVECASIDEAAEWAARIPDVRHGSVEVRPIMTFDQPEAPAAGAAEVAG